jgi:small GTP-binding protein
MNPANYVYKVILGGEGAVGKTTLIYRLKTGLFTDDTNLTIGVDFYPYNVEYKEQSITLQIWDLGGQEQFQFLHQNYTAGASLAILVHDLTRHSTAEKLLTTWVPMMRKQKKTLPIILVGSKLDLVDPIEAQGQIEKELFNPIHAIDHFLISSKSGVGVTELFNKVVAYLYDNMKPHIKSL